jgi:Protein of unknown function (DUF3489)
MAKSTKKRLPTKLKSSAPSAKPSKRIVGKRDSAKTNAGSKQSRVIAMLRSPAGTTVAAMMKTTGWQQHSVRGFLAGVVRKRLKLKLDSKDVDGTRVYRVTGGGAVDALANRKPNSFAA